MKTLLSLFDHSGKWSEPFKAVADVFCVDIKNGIDILTWDYKAWGQGRDVVGILAAPPCTDFAAIGSQYWKEKDMSGKTEKSIELVNKTLEIVEYFNPKFWALENPKGRIEKCCPTLKGKRCFTFQPCEFGDAYTKRTIIWGYCLPFLVRNFIDIKRKKDKANKRIYNPFVIDIDIYWIEKLGLDVKALPAKIRAELRSVTPGGFAKAFFETHKIYFDAP